MPQIPYNQLSSGGAVQSESGSKIRDLVSGIEETLGHLHGAADALEKRLDTVTTPVPTISSTISREGLAASNPQSHLAERVDQIRIGLSNLGARLSDITRRIEI